MIVNFIINVLSNFIYYMHLYMHTSMCIYNEMVDHSSLLSVWLNPDNFLKKIRKALCFNQEEYSSFLYRSRFCKDKRYPSLMSRQYVGSRMDQSRKEARKTKSAALTAGRTLSKKVMGIDWPGEQLFNVIVQGGRNCTLSFMLAKIHSLSYF